MSADLCIEVIHQNVHSFLDHRTPYLVDFDGALKTYWGKGAEPNITATIPHN